MITRQKCLTVEASSPDLAGAMIMAKNELGNWSSHLRQLYFGDTIVDGQIVITGRRPDGSVLMDWDQVRARLGDIMLVHDAGDMGSSFQFLFLLEIDDDNPSPVEDKDSDVAIFRTL